MQWSNHPDRQSGDVKIFSSKGKFVLVEAMNDGGYFEVVSGTYERVQKEYERIYENANDTFYGHIEGYESNEGRDIWNLQSDEERGNGYRDNKSAKSQGPQNNTSGSVANLHSSNKGKSVKNERAEITEDEVILQSKKAMAA